MAAFSMRIDENTADVRRFLNGIEADIKRRAIVPALNKTAAKVKTEIVRKISADTSAKQKILRKKIKITKANRGGAKRAAREYAVVDADDAKAVNLIEYVRPGQRRVGFFNKVMRSSRGGVKRYRAAGVVATVSGKRKTYKGSFIGSTKGGDLKVFRRLGRAREKIQRVSGPSPRGYFKRPETHKFMRDVAIKQFPVELNRAIKMILSKRGRK